MERQERSVESGPVSSRVPHTVIASRLLALVASLFAATATLARRPIAFFREDSAAAEERPRTRGQRVWYGARFLFLLVPVTQIIGLLWMIWTRTAQVPYRDEWETVLLDQQFKQGTLSFHDIVLFHNTAHRIIIPRLIDLALINLTSYNRQVEMTFDLGIGVASACLLFWCVRRTLGSLTAALVLVAPLSLLFFSFAQYADWFAPFQIQFIVTVFGAVCCMTGFAKKPVSRKGFALALAGALIGSLSGLHGLVAWIAFLPGALRGGVRKAVAWVSSGVIVWFLYFQHFPHTPTQISISADIAYSLAYLGSPVGFPNLGETQIAGILSILLLLGNVLLYWVRHRSLWHIAPWLQLAVFVLGGVQATAVGRVGYGAYQALDSRYQAFSALWWIALLVIMGLNVKELWPELYLHLRGGVENITTLGMTGIGVAVVNLVALLFITVNLIPVNLAGVHLGLMWQDSQRQNQGAVVHFQTASDSCLGLYDPAKPPDVLRARARFLEQQHLAIFSGADSSSGATFNPSMICYRPPNYYGNVSGGDSASTKIGRLRWYNAATDGEAHG